MPISATPDSFIPDAFQREVLGEALFALLAEREPDSARVSPQGTIPWSETARALWLQYSVSV
jgi:hypothetical protein